MAERDRSPTPELWDKHQAAEHLGIHPDSVRQWTRRNGIPVIRRRVEKGRARALYNADDIRDRRPAANAA
jgi:DNA-binding transcriptional MerR regulator